LEKRKKKKTSRKKKEGQAVEEGGMGNDIVMPVLPIGTVNLPQYAWCATSLTLPLLVRTRS
jgi:hypothetical protein